MTRPTFLTTAELADLTHTTPGTWRRRRVSGDGPPYVRFGPRVLYRLDHVLEWLDSQTVRSTSEWAELRRQASQKTTLQ